MFSQQAPQADKAELRRAHCPAHVERFLRGELKEKEMRSIGFPWSEGLVRRSRASAGGTLAATRALLEWNLRITANIAGRLPPIALLLPLPVLRRMIPVESTTLNDRMSFLGLHIVKSSHSLPGG